MATVLATPSASFGSWRKRCFDFVFALAVLLVGSVLMLALFLVARADGGPAIYRHRRIGHRGEFDCLKFRTMRVDGDAILKAHLDSNPAAKLEWDTHRKLREDPRVTPAGRLMRKLSLDELPQLWNIVIGEMSLVGPRPIVREEAIRYGEALSAYLSVRPGLTGLWQISARGAEFERRIELDCRYAAERSAAMDLAILARTFPVVLSSRGAS